MVCCQRVFSPNGVVDYLPMTTATISSPRTLSDLIPRSKGNNAKAVSIAINAALVVSFALITAVLAQVSITLSFTPVPITGQTLAVLVSGATLGTAMGMSSQILYVFLGAVGLPFYANHSSGWDVLKGATGGYFIGFIVASAIIGFLAERKNDRKVLSAIGAFVVGSVVIYGFGATWLAHSLGIPFAKGAQSAMSLGVIPFLFGDLLKVALAGLIIPGSWKAVSYLRNEKKSIDLEREHASELLSADDDVKAFKSTTKS